MPYDKQRSVTRELAQYAKDSSNPPQGRFRMAYSVFRMRGATAEEAERLAIESVRKTFPTFTPVQAGSMPAARWD
jgi:hypothetical protein